MPRLTAKYQLEFPGPVLLQSDGMEPAPSGRPRFAGSRLVYKSEVGDFTATLRVIPDLSGWSARDGNALLSAFDGELLVSRHESEPVPEVGVTSAGGRDLTTRSPYFRERQGEYADAARTALKRFFTCVRFRLGQPLVWGTGDEAPHVIRSTKWLDEDGEEINPGIEIAGASGSGVRWTSWGSTPISASNEGDIAEALGNPVNPSLPERLLAQGKDAALQGDLRRAVLEFAICCEVGIKRTFFERGSPAGEAFEYFEDSGKLRMRVLDLVGEPARRAFGQSFKEADPGSFQQLDWLFRCRNKVAHRGVLVFRDDKGVLHEVDRSAVKAWWAAADRLVRWLAKFDESPDPHPSQVENPSNSA